ncbi:phosphate ABC transporter substrate-binding protein [Nitratidesulfovibrio vulgaris]|jgi:phosphate transport system substrate-binding protein|uniref:Phosphate-binding protein n=2 Tax=Nitratidesulfovibrio vulgaris TaxID=881 RepID=Q728X5_NITV2|nr:phosphate ABC transporter substrate-binding protein [Nitratidesulfovibrio vulgaris]GEB80913.1 phosphate ABC transporter substrate-binding protein [Desulfovibrio desulfuricans]HBW15924.1 phosphate ABC transporter substrate-binding protein [Desulfovibrio sp.]AAS96949.1 phosphate ABC transporter, periplasmic phosphate-binding protein PstS [Nitratidesulfovibrio vulgaris str. Hildenborough]ABM27788.1 phosphate ABC transporter substrate-binding protein, PhoT family [Nitratidesulfovibrio vulgaris D
MSIKRFALVALMTLGLAANAFAADKIVVKGSTTVLPIMQKAAEAYMKKTPGVEIEISGGGSGNGIKALIDGTLDICMSSRKIKDKEVEAAKANGREAVEHIVALDAILPIVNKGNPVDNLTIDQLRAIYEGKITNWKEVGGKDEAIVVISRDTSSGTYESWQHFVMKDAKVFPGALLQASSGAVLQAVSKNSKAISYDGIGYVNDTVKATKVNGVTGSAATAKDGSYAMARDLQIYTPGQPQGAVKNFIDFMKSAEGQALVQEAGFIPTK